MYPKKDLFPETILLNSRGWTPELIAEILEGPDVIHAYPRDETRPTARFYLRKRVHVAEQIETVAAIVSTRNEELEIHRAAKRERAWKNMQDALAAAEISVKAMPLSQLQTAAIESFYARLASDRRQAPATIDKSRLWKIYMNFAVGQLVDYDAISAALPRPLDRRKIYDLISDRIAEKVLEVYPDLRTEREETVDV
jgi:hypothetical protein